MGLEAEISSWTAARNSRQQGQLKQTTVKEMVKMREGEQRTEGNGSARKDVPTMKHLAGTSNRKTRTNLTSPEKVLRGGGDIRKPQKPGSLSFQTKPLDCFETGVDVRFCARATRHHEMDGRENTGKRLATQKSELSRGRIASTHVNNSQS